MTQPDDTGPETVVSEISWLRRLARSLVRDEPTADDVVQDACVAAMHGPPPQRGRVRGWLAAVVRNAARRSHRDRLRRAGREALAARPEAVPGAAETAERLETARTLLAAVESLDEPYRTAVRLRWLDGFPPREVAARLGVSQEVAWKRLSRGLAMLRARLDRDRGGRAAWLVLVADLGRVEPREMPFGPLVGTALTASLAPMAIVAAACALVVAGAAVAASLVAEGPGANGQDAASLHERSLGPARPADASRAPRLRAASDNAEPGRPAASAQDAQAEEAVVTDRIVGRVLTPDGAPAVGAEVDVTDVSGRPSDRRAITGADGRFVLPVAVGDGSRRLVIVRSAAWGLEAAPVLAPEPCTTDVGDIRLSAKAGVAGCVVDAEGRGIEGAVVELCRPAWGIWPLGARTDPDGSFRFDDVGPGDWKVGVIAPSLEWVQRFRTRVVQGGSTDTRIVLQRRRIGNAQIPLQIVDGAGRTLQLEGLQVHASGTFERGGDRSARVTWTNGRTGSVPEIEALPPGDWTIWLKPTGYAATSISVHVEPWDTSIPLRVIALLPGRVEVVPAFEGGVAPLASFVEVRPQAGITPGGECWNRDGETAASILVTGQEGPTANALVAGRYRVRLHAAGWFADEFVIDVASEETTIVRMTARRGGNLNWEPNVPDGAEAEFAFAARDCDFVVWGTVAGTGSPSLLALTAFPPGPLRWRVRVAERDAVAPGEPRDVATYEGVCDVVAGGITNLPEGPFAAPTQR